MNEVISFQDALILAEEYNTKHLLLGNGFSIACVPSIFTYKSLFDEADFKNNPEIKDTFSRLSTTDFEIAIHALDYAALVLPAYDKKSSAICKKMKQDADKIKELLISTIAERHPAFPSEIETSKIDACRKFIAHFINKNSTGRIYSLNYDLLLYWTLMNELDDEKSEVKISDGFGRETWIEDGEVKKSDELTWQGKSSGQNVYYLHGALHLFDGAGQLEKFSWVDTGKPLIEQARKDLQEDKFPLFVAEGDSKKKMAKINHSAYLYTANKSFEEVAKGGKGKLPGSTCFFTYGVSFGDNDKHVFKKIANGRIKHLFVSIYGKPESKENKKIIKLAEELKSKRQVHPLKITYYDASSANVWGNN